MQKKIISIFYLILHTYPQTFDVMFFCKFCASKPDVAVWKPGPLGEDPYKHRRRNQRPPQKREVEVAAASPVTPSH